MRAPSLETIGMTKIFGSLVALEDVSIKVEPGTVHALLGENGAGKSTLVKCIMGFYSAGQRPGSARRQGGADPQPARRPRARHRHGLPAFYAGAVAHRCRKSGHQPRRRARRDRLEEGDGVAQCVSRPHAVPRAARRSGLRHGGRRKAEAGNPETALSRPAAAHSRRADLGAHARRGRRDARPAARHDAAQGDHRDHDHAQVPRGDELLRQRDGAAPRPQGRRRRGQGPHHRSHGADDDRRHPDPRSCGSWRQAAGRYDSRAGGALRQ